MNKLFIISDNTRIEQERLFLQILNKFNNFEIYYCVLNKKKEILRKEYSKILFLEYQEFLSSINNNQNNFIIYFNYYGNLDNLDFSDNNLIIFGHYLFYKNKIKFTNLKEVNVFDFFRLNKSKENIKNLFSGIKINFISDINYPSAVNYLKYRNLKNKEKYRYDIFFPLGSRGDDLDFIKSIVNKNKDLKFLIGPINHNGLNTSIIEKINELIFNKENIDYFKVISSDYFSEKILLSKIIILPLNDKDYIFGDLTRISDSLALGKTIITNKVECTSHIGNLLFYDSLEDLIFKVDNIFKQKIYENNYEYNNIIKYYDENNSIVKLTGELYKFLLKY